jgi:type VI secretion system protein ImpK
MRRQAEEWGLDRCDADLASFALVAFADETAVKIAGACKVMWPLLQYEYFGTHHAGEEYFDHLLKIQGNGSAAARWRDPTRASLLELYFLCLFLGFRGRWAASTPDEIQGELDYFRKYVRSKPLGLLSPHGTPQGLQRPPRGDGRIWSWVGIFVHLALLLGLGLLATRWLGLV